MKQTIKHGAEIEVLTPDEAARMLNDMRASERPSRVRATASVKLDAAGNAQDEVFVVPAGYEFALRRVTLDLDSAADPSTGNVALNVAGKTVEYLRSGTRIEYAAPVSPNAIPQVPGVQTWGDQQGPYFRNAEVFEVRVKGLTANALLSVIAEGIMSRPAK